MKVRFAAILCALTFLLSAAGCGWHHGHRGGACTKVKTACACQCPCPKAEAAPVK